MEFSELADVEVSAGVLTEWLPTVATEDWSADERPASYIHEAHLRRSAPTRADGSTRPAPREAWLGTVFALPPDDGSAEASFDTDVFERALRAWIDRHEALRSHTDLAPTDSAHTDPAHTDPAHPTPDGQPVRRRTAAPNAVTTVRIEHDAADGPTISRHLHDLFDEVTDPATWPAYAFATLRHPSGTVSVYFAADHSIIDGYSIVLVAHEIRALYEQERTGRAADLFPVGSYLDFGAAERAEAAEVTADHPAVVTWRERLSDTGTAPRFPLPIGPRPDPPRPQRSRHGTVLDDAEATAFAEWCRARDVGFFAGVLGCLAAVAADRTGAPDFATVTPAHTRTGPMWAGSLGWFVGLRPFRIGTGPDLPASTRVSDPTGSRADVATLARRAAIDLAATREGARTPFDRVAEILGVPIRPRFVVSFMDVRFVPHAARWPAWGARALRSRSVTHDVYVWFNRTPEGLSMSARFPDTDEAAASVPAFLDHAIETIRSVACPPGAAADAAG